MKDGKISSAVDVMIRTDKLHKHLLDSKMKSIGIRLTYHRILMYVAKNNRLVSQKSIAEHMGITPAAVTGALKKLENDGYIRRKQGNDNRFNVVEITDRGKSVVEKSRALFFAVDTSLFEGFTEEELDGYITYLGKILENIKKQLPNTEGGCDKQK